MGEDKPLQLVSRIGTRLARQTRPSKDFIRKSLEEATKALFLLKQVQAVAEKRKAALKPLANAVACGLLQHDDKEVRLLVASCVTELFRVLAPEPPFEEQNLRDVFKLFISLFADLADTKSTYLSKRAEVLETVAKLKCCVLMLEFDTDLVHEMFNTFFSVVRNDHKDILIKAMSSIMIQILDDSEGSQSQQLLEVILRNLMVPNEGVTCAAYRLAASVIKNCAREDELISLVFRYLTSCMYDEDTVDSGLNVFYLKTILEVLQHVPQMQFHVIPSLIGELLANQVDVRIKAVNLVEKLFTLREYQAAQKYHDLFIEFLNRFSDVSVNVRISALQCAKALYMANPYGRESDYIITSVEDRLLDFDDQVRMLAVHVACDISISNLKHVPTKLISLAIERLRDKKVSVRKMALQKLIEVYQVYCKKCYEGSMNISNCFEQIPSNIMMLCYDKDCYDFRSQNVESVLANTIFPKDLSVEERTKHWIHMYSLFKPLHEKALNTILSQKRGLQNEMKTYLDMRKNLKEIHSEEMQEKIECMFKKMAASFPDSHKAKECLHKLNQIKDNNVFKSLEKLLEEQTFTIGEVIKDELWKMIGGNNPYYESTKRKNPYYEFLLSLFSKCSSNIFSSEHVQCILDYLSNNKSGNKDLEDSSANLLLVIVRNFPSMLKGLEMLEPTSPIIDKLIEVLAKAGSQMCINFSDIYPYLKRMCMDGTRRQAKFAVSAIAALSSEQSVFLNLYEGLIYSLYSRRNVPTILQSLGCVAQYSVSTFETRNEEITSHISQKIIQMEHLDDGHDVTSFHDSSPCCKSCQLKIYGLKTLVRSSLPYQGNCVKQNINGLLEILSKMLRESDNFVRADTHSCVVKYQPRQGNGVSLSRNRKRRAVDSVPEDAISAIAAATPPSRFSVLCENDKAHIRLAAAKAILRLARKWDLHITPEIFRFTILTAKDNSDFVRSKFISKTQKLLKEHRLPIRYACAFAMGVSDGIENLQHLNYKYMAEFIKDYGIIARKRRSSAAKAAIINHPAYILVFLIHVLARDDFPFDVCKDEKMCSDLCCPLFFVLQAFVDVNMVDGDLDLVNEAVLYLFSIFRGIRNAEDAVDVQMTKKLHMLAEMGIFTLKALSHGIVSASQSPGQVLLPSSLYRVGLAKNSANSKCPKSFFSESFLSRVFHTLKESNASQAHAQKTAKTFPELGCKGQQDAPKSNTNICGALVVASTEPDDLSMSEMANARTLRPDIHPANTGKYVPPSGSGSIGLLECSTIKKQRKLASKQCKKTSQRKLLSSSDSVSCKGSLAESNVQSRKSKRGATYSLENAVKSCKQTAQHSRYPRTELKDTCSKNKGKGILADVSNEYHFGSNFYHGECSYSLSSIKETTATTGDLAAKERISENQENTSVSGSRICTESSTSVVANTNAYAGRTRRKV